MNPIVLNKRYQLGQRIGVGGMAYVYEAEDLLLKRKVAVKVLKDQFIEDEEFVAKFEKEAQAAASLMHPNIVNVYDVGREVIDDRVLHYIVMELIEGTTLKEAISAHGKMTSAAIARTGRQIARALQRAHERDLVHRDIKPANILITRNGDIKVTDFGIARITSSSTVTFTNNILGTVHYISPEQAKGQPVDAKSDLYSLGVVMYEMATGQVPFDADSSVAIAMKHIQEVPVPPIERNPSLHPGLNQIILKCMAKDPIDRFESATELAEALDNYHDLDDTVFLPTVNRTARISGYDGESREAVYVSGGRREEQKTSSAKFSMRSVVMLAALGLAVFFLVAFFLLRQNDRSLGDGISVPAVINLPEQEALQMLSQSGLVGQVTERRKDDRLERGVVIDQSIVSGTKVPKGTVVNLSVSEGKGEVEIPDVRGVSAEEATQTLQNAGFRIGQTQFVFDATVPKGQVIRTDPAVGESAALDARIDLYVSRGKEAEQSVVPVLLNQGQNQAIAQLKEAGLRLGNMTSEFSTYPSGTVIAQSIEAGTEVPANTAVDITVSSGQKPSSNSKPSDLTRYNTHIYPPEGKDTFEVVIYDRNQSMEQPIFKKTMQASEAGEEGYITAQVEASSQADLVIYIDGVPADTSAPVDSNAH